MGVQLIRVLLTKVKPILVIAFTNHALDHLLEAVLEANITQSVVRLGSRASERLSQYSLENLELASNDRNSPLEREKRNEGYQLKLLRGSIEKLVEKIAQEAATDAEVQEHLLMSYPEHLAALRAPAPWIHALYEDLLSDISHGWMNVGQTALAEQTMLDFWAAGTDLNVFRLPVILKPSFDPQPAFAANKGASFNKFDALSGSVDDDQDDCDDDHAAEVAFETVSASDFEAVSDVPDDLESAWMRVPTAIDIPSASKPSLEPTASSAHPSDTLSAPSSADPPRTQLEFFSGFNMPVPNMPDSDRPLDDLLLDSEVWAMSLRERQRLHAVWTQEAGEINHISRVTEFESLRKQLAERQKRYNSLRDRVRGKFELAGLRLLMHFLQATLKLLEGRDIIACTTTGAAKLTALMRVCRPSHSRHPASLAHTHSRYWRQRLS